MNTDNTRGDDNKDMATEVKKLFVNQFAANQNHHQSLFIQFLSVVIIALVAYGYVYINTSVYAPEDLNNTEILHTAKDSIQFIQLKDAETFKTIKDSQGRIFSYSKVHLVGTFLFAQLVLVVLSLTLLHMGYTYRRDQQVVHTIRVESLGIEGFKKLFPTGYTGLGKRFVNWLPNFYAILFIAIFLIQLILYWSLFLYFNRIPETEIIENKERLRVFLEGVGFGYDLSYRTLKLGLALPIGISFFAYFLYFTKYNTRINNIRLTTQLTITHLSNERVVFVTGIICLIFAVIKASLIFFLNFYSLALLASAIISLVAFLAHASTKRLRLQERGINISNGIFYFLSAVAILLITFICVINHTFQITSEPIELFVITFCVSSFLYVISHIFHKRLLEAKSNKVFISHQLRQESYFFSLLSILYLLILFSKIKFLDYVLSALFGLLSLMWSIRSITYLLDEELGRKRINGKLPLVPPGESDGDTE